jgi:uncharacterized membrane protein YphA (DoxX/SURF4 family)
MTLVSLPAVQRLAPLTPALVRLAVGSVLIGHGFHFTPTEFGGLLKGAGVPFPMLFSWLVTLLLFGGGGLLIVGLLSRLVAIPALVHLTLAIFMVEVGEGFTPKSGGGVQIPLLLIAGLLVVLLTGPGPVSLDAAIGWDNGWEHRRPSRQRSGTPSAA